MLIGVSDIHNAVARWRWRSVAFANWAWAGGHLGDAFETVGAMAVAGGGRMLRTHAIGVWGTTTWA
jgi:hypothetical protein